MKKLVIGLLALFALKAFPQQSLSAVGGSVANCNCSGDMWDVSNPLKPNVTFSAAGVSHRLLITDFNFNIPPTATVTGYEVGFTYTSNITTHIVKDSLVQLLFNNTAAGISQESLTGNYAGNNVVLIGDPTNIWGVWAAPSQLNDPSFGFQFKLKSNLGGVKVGLLNGATITIYYVTASGIKESQSMTSRTKLYTNKKNVVINSDLPENSELTIYNILGAKLMSARLDANSSKELDLSYFSEGMYVYTIKSGTKEKLGKFILE
jgi:hypothetical protein